LGAGELLADALKREAVRKTKGPLAALCRFDAKKIMLRREAETDSREYNAFIPPSI
jgi:hypothetical protein